MFPLLTAVNASHVCDKMGGIISECMSILLSFEIE